MSDYTDLLSAFARIEQLEDEVKSLEATIDEKEIEIDNKRYECGELEKELDEKSALVMQDIETCEVVSAVDRFLDEIHRPVGTRDFTVPKSHAVDRAILGLHDAIGRNL